MLVLTRKPGQAITIGDNVEIVVVDIKGDQIRLGITAPREVPVHRKEVYEQVCQENMQATMANPKIIAEVLNTSLRRPAKS